MLKPGSPKYLEDVAPAELVMSANAPALLDSDEDDHDEPLESPSTTSCDLPRILVQIQESIRWSDDFKASVLQLYIPAHVRVSISNPSDVLSPT